MWDDSRQSRGSRSAGRHSFKESFAADLLQMQLRSSCHAIQDCSVVLGLIPAGEQAAGDDLRLDLRSAFEDIEDAGVA